MCRKTGGNSHHVKYKLFFNINSLVFGWGGRIRTREWRKTQQILAKPSWRGMVYREVRDGDRPTRVGFVAYWRRNNDNPTLKQFPRCCEPSARAD
jgi:hypothetical protein